MSTRRAYSSVSLYNTAYIKTTSCEQQFIVPLSPLGGQATNKRFQNYIIYVYPKELTIEETTKSEITARYLDLPFETKMTNFQQRFKTNVMSLVSILQTFHFCLGNIYLAHYTMSRFRNS